MLYRQLCGWPGWHNIEMICSWVFRFKVELHLLELVGSLVNSKSFFFPEHMGTLLHVLHIFTVLVWSLPLITEISYAKQSYPWPFTTASIQGPALEMDMHVNNIQPFFIWQVCSSQWSLDICMSSFSYEWIHHIRNKQTYPCPCMFKRPADNPWEKCTWFHSPPNPTTLTEA